MLSRPFNIAGVLIGVILVIIAVSMYIPQAFQILYYSTGITTLGAMAISLLSAVVIMVIINTFSGSSTKAYPEHTSLEEQNS